MAINANQIVAVRDTEKMGVILVLKRDHETRISFADAIVDNQLVRIAGSIEDIIGQLPKTNASYQLTDVVEPVVEQEPQVSEPESAIERANKIALKDLPALLVQREQQVPQG
jgi:hypothetical protein